MPLKWLRQPIAFLAGVLITSSLALAASPEQVAQSIEKGREWLLSQQKNGNWEKSQRRLNNSNADVEGGQWGGLTSIATYALLASGQPITDPRMQEAIKFLRNADIKGVYALGLRAQVWSLLPKEDWVKAAIDRDAKLLLDGVLSGTDNTGLYDYLIPPVSPIRVDHSVSQYGVLGAWALEKSGAQIPPKYWELVEKVWTDHQDISGGWSYARRASNDDGGVKISMTAAGVATLYITQDYLHANEGIQPRGNITRPEIEAGMKWMADNFSTVGNNYYAWYGIERIGVASGRKYFGPHNWYEKGAEALIKQQGKDGKWSGSHGDVANTSFCLVFLSRGRAPIMMSKLQYEVIDSKTKKPVEGLWNQRPRDVANLTRWVGERIEQNLNWQIVNLDAPADELAEAPILYISGSAPLNLSDAHKEKLKAFVENGGLILGNPDGGRPQFTESFKKLGESLFPGYSFAELREKHPIYTGQQFQRSRWKVKPRVEALGNGAREFMIIGQQFDPARQWQLNEDAKREDLFQLPANIFLYAVDKNMQFKGERKVLKADPAIATNRNVTVARLQYDGNWNPEPAGWQRMQAYMRNRQGTDLKVETVNLGEGKLLSTHQVAHLTGTEAIHFTPEQKAEIKKYVEGGGTLLIDAAGGKSAFRTAIETELTSIFGTESENAFTESLKPDNALYIALGDAAGSVEYRPYVRTELSKLPKEPRLRGLEVNGKYRVIYSPQDMSVGMMGQPVDGIFGYTPASATNLMSSLLLYAAK